MDVRTMLDVVADNAAKKERRKLAERLRAVVKYELGRYGVRSDAEGWLVFRSDIEVIIAELEGETGGEA